MGRSRIDGRFAALKEEGRSALVAFITAGDPDAEVSAQILNGLPAAGADIIELGMPFSDPMADGPAIQEASERALAAGMTIRGVLSMVRAFRKTDSDTPLILMGYLNPVLAYGEAAFMADAAGAGVDGLILVDMPPEEDSEIRALAGTHDLSIIRLMAPTSTDTRLKTILPGAGGFLYYIAVAGVTGSKSAELKSVDEALARIRKQTDLPICVGFGIKTPEQAAEIAGIADGVVVGSAIVSRIGKAGAAGAREKALDFVRSLASGLRRA